MPTLNILIATGADDGVYRLNAGAFDNSSTSFTYIGYNGVSFGAFLRFQNITIPPGSTITAASVRFVPASSRSGTCPLILTGELALNPSAAASAADALGRSRTVASVGWNEPDHTVNVAVSTPDFSAVIQEIIDQSGWASGNALQLFVDDNGSSSFRQPRTYNGSTTNCPRLDVDYTEPSTGNRRRRLLLAA